MVMGAASAEPAPSSLPRTSSWNLASLPREPEPPALRLPCGAMNQSGLSAASAAIDDNRRSFRRRFRMSLTERTNSRAGLAG
eukprot:1070058-Pyramimonas_sp.AAC.1